MDQVVDFYNQIDAVISDKVYALGDVFNMDFRPTTYVTENWPLVSSPTPCILLLLKYILVVGVCFVYQKTFPAKEKKPEGPFFKAFVMFHNLFLSLLSLWMMVKTLYHALTSDYTLIGDAYIPERDADFAWVVYIFYLSKYYEFIDTYIMLIKGNLKQVSFLHVYHHLSTAFIFALVTKIAPGGDAWFSISFNSGVHVIMYMYYFLAAIIKTPEERKKYLWWGKYLTQLQLTQFFCNIIQAGLSYFYSPYWAAGKYLQIVDVSVLIVLFMNFYIQKYQKPAKSVSVNKKVD